MIIIPRPWFLYCKIEVWIVTTYPILTLRKGFWEAKYSPLKHTWWLPIFNTWITLCLLRPFLFIHQLTITFTIYNRKLTFSENFEVALRELSLFMLISDLSSLFFFNGKFSHGFPLGKNQSKWLDLQFEFAYYEISI